MKNRRQKKEKNERKEEERREWEIWRREWCLLLVEEYERRVVLWLVKVENKREKGKERRKRSAAVMGLGLWELGFAKEYD